MFLPDRVICLTACCASLSPKLPNFSSSSSSSLARCLVRGTIAITANSSAALFLPCLPACLPSFSRLVRPFIHRGRDVSRGFGDPRPSLSGTLSHLGWATFSPNLFDNSQPLFIPLSSSSFFRRRRRRRRKKWWQIVTPVNSSLRHPSLAYEALPAAAAVAACACVSSATRLTRYQRSGASERRSAPHWSWKPSNDSKVHMVKHLHSLRGYPTGEGAPSF